MVCFSGQCLKALALTSLVALCPCVGNTQGLLDASFGRPAGIESTAFLVNGGRQVVTLGLAGRNLGAAQLVGGAVAPTSTLADPVSRVVVFEMPSAVAGAFQLAPQAPIGGLLRTPGGALGGRIEGRLEKIGGKYLPFTLLKLAYDGAPPKPGTPLLDAAGKVAAVAHEATGGKGGYAVPVEVLHRVLDAAEQGRGVERAWLGLKLHPGKNLPQVTQTVAGSPANRAGLQAGDVITEIGGLKVGDYGDAVNAFFLLRPDQPTSLKVKRGGAERVLELVPTMAKR